MTQRRNEFGQAIGEPVPNWNGAALPPREAVKGRFCVVEPLDVERHVDDLFAAFSEDKDGRLWTYMPTGPFPADEVFCAWAQRASQSSDPLFYALRDQLSGKAGGIAAYMRIQPEVGVIEVGNIAFSPRMQKTPAATEAMFMMMRRAFDELGYRRYEWKCDSLNDASRRAAERLGFTFEGIFRQALVYKGRNRDTAWYSVIDSEWPAIKDAFVRWLDAGNFDDDGRQKSGLRELISGRCS